SVGYVCWPAGHTVCSCPVLCRPADRRRLHSFPTRRSSDLDVTQVEWVYARHMCAITGPGTDWKTSVRVAGPLAVRFGHHAEVRVPPPGPGYPERVKELFPERLHEEAFAELDDGPALDTARERFEQAKQAK